MNKILFLITFCSLLAYGQYDMPVAAVFGYTSGMSEGYRIQEAYHHYSSLAEKKSLNNKWHNWKLASYASGVTLGATIVLDGEKKDYLQLGLDVLTDAMIFKIISDGVINTHCKYPFFYQSPQSGWIGEMYVSPQGKIFLLLSAITFRLAYKYLWSN